MMVCTMYKENIERGRVRKKWYRLRTSQGIHNGINVDQYEFSTVDDVTKERIVSQEILERSILRKWDIS